MSPYGHQWTIENGAKLPTSVELLSHGRYRFEGMSMGDAIDQVLEEAGDGEPLTLNDIAARIARGRLAGVSARELNGALTGKIGKTVARIDPDGPNTPAKYTRMDDPDDIPF